MNNLAVMIFLQMPINQSSLKKRAFLLEHEADEETLNFISQDTVF